MTSFELLATEKKIVPVYFTTECFTKAIPDRATIVKMRLNQSLVDLNSCTCRLVMVWLVLGHQLLRQFSLKFYQYMRCPSKVVINISIYINIYELLYKQVYMYSMSFAYICILCRLLINISIYYQYIIYELLYKQVYMYSMSFAWTASLIELAWYKQANRSRSENDSLTCHMFATKHAKCFTSNKVNRRNVSTDVMCLAFSHLRTNYLSRPLLTYILEGTTTPPSPCVGASTEGFCPPNKRPFLSENQQNPAKSEGNQVWGAQNTKIFWGRTPRPPKWYTSPLPFLPEVPFRSWPLHWKILKRGPVSRTILMMMCNDNRIIRRTEVSNLNFYLEMTPLIFYNWSHNSVELYLKCDIAK